MFSFFVTLMVVSFVAGAAVADCPAKPPQANWNTESGDKTVGVAYLQKLLSGRKVKYQSGGLENYRKNGKYSFSMNGQKWNAPSYRFYENGVRCIAYDAPRFDRYVVNNGTLVLINYQGQRFPVKVTN